MAAVAAAMSSLFFLLSMMENVFPRRSMPGEYSLFRQFLQAETNKLSGLGMLACTARGARDRGRGLRLTVAEIDQRGNCVGNRARRAVIVDRAGEIDQRRFDIGKGRRLVLQFRDDALGDLGPDARRARHRGLVAPRNRVGKL